MKRGTLGLVAAAIAILTFLAGYWFGGGASKDETASGARRILYYVDPMNPGHRYEKPGIAPCGMALEPVYSDGEGASQAGRMLPGSVYIPPGKQQLIGVKVEQVEKGEGARTIRLLGKVVPDETRVYQLNSSVQGWIRKVSPFSTGSYVKKGQLLATFYAPEFLAAEQAYIYSLSSSTFKPTFKVGAAQPNLIGQTTQQYADNLRILGMGDNQIHELARTKEFQYEIRIESPVDGFILSRNISPGLRFDKGAEFYRIANIQKVWIVLDTYGDEAKYLRPGQKVPFRSQGKSYHGTVTDVLPQFDPVTRTMKVRLEAANPRYHLRPDMFVDVEFAANMPSAITVPIDAVLDSGLKKTIFVDKGNGVFEPRLVETGSYYNDRVEILKGIMPGERIVVSGNFLIDSESRMKAPATGASGNASMDPACGMMVNEENARGAGLTIESGGKTYFFCSRECKEQFEKSPRTSTGGKVPSTPGSRGKPAGNIHDHHVTAPDHKGHQMPGAVSDRKKVDGGMKKKEPAPMPGSHDHQGMHENKTGGHPHGGMGSTEQMPAPANHGEMKMENGEPEGAATHPPDDGMGSHD